MSPVVNQPVAATVQHFNTFSVFEPQQEAAVALFSALEPLIGIPVPMKFRLSGFINPTGDAHHSRVADAEASFHKGAVIISVPQKQSGHFFYPDQSINDALRDYLATNAFWFREHDAAMRHSLTEFLDAWTVVEKILADAQQAHPPREANRPGGPEISVEDKLIEIKAAIAPLTGTRGMRWHQDNKPGRKVSLSDHTTDVTDENPFDYLGTGDGRKTYSVETLHANGFTPTPVEPFAPLSFDTEATWHKEPSPAEPVIRSKILAHYR